MNNSIEIARNRLIETAGRITQDFGIGRIIGQVMAYVYLTEEETSLDEIGDQLGLSKAAVSIATRQLEGLGLFKRVWKQGDRKCYYNTVDNFAKALQHGILETLRNKLRVAGEELDIAEEDLNGSVEHDPEAKFLKSRVDRAKKIKKRATQLLDNPILKFIGSR